MCLLPRTHLLLLPAPLAYSCRLRRGHSPGPARLLPPAPRPHSGPQAPSAAHAAAASRPAPPPPAPRRPELRASTSAWLGRRLARNPSPPATRGPERCLARAPPPPAPVVPPARARRGEKRWRRSEQETGGDGVERERTRPVDFPERVHPESRANIRSEGWLRSYAREANTGRSGSIPRRSSTNAPLGLIIVLDTTRHQFRNNDQKERKHNLEKSATKFCIKTS